LRHLELRVHSDTPMNAETPPHLLTRSWLTPNSLFYVRHHHPVSKIIRKRILQVCLGFRQVEGRKRKRYHHRYRTMEIRVPKILIHHH
jgi:hypothetical protein